MAQNSTDSSSTKLPTLFLSHGGGPSFYLSADDNPRFTGIDKDSEAAHWFRGLAKSMGFEGEKKPAALVVISAHWETSEEVKITSRQSNPDLYYDYGGFPAETYELKWPAPGNPALSAKIHSLLTAAGIKSSLETKRNFDHGVFVPLKLVFPEADIPVIQVSILRSLDPAAHIKIGSALQSLREQNILLIGSGYATHAFQGLTTSQAKGFVSALDDKLTKSVGAEREKALVEWAKLPYARNAHPREDHLIPLHVVVGAAGGEAKGSKIYDYIGTISIFSLACWRFD